MKIPENKDGSTSNLAEFVWYTRESIMNNFIIFYFAQLFWSIISAIIIYYITKYSFCGIVSKDGQILDIWNFGAFVTMIHILIVHFFIIVELRSYSRLFILMLMLSFLFIIFTVLVSDRSSTTEYYRNQAVLYGNPLFFLTSFLLVFVIVVPRFIIIRLEMVVFHPEFNFIKP